MYLPLFTGFYLHTCRSFCDVYGYELRWTWVINTCHISSSIFDFILTPSIGSLQNLWWSLMCEISTAVPRVSWSILSGALLPTARAGCERINYRTNQKDHAVSVKNKTWQGLKLLSSFDKLVLWCFSHCSRGAPNGLAKLLINGRVDEIIATLYI